LHECGVSDFAAPKTGFFVSRVASLDLLRGLAAWTVAIPHFFIYHSVHLDFFEAVSILGVEIFFVLSGYVLAPQILICITEAKPRFLGIFLIRRWMRTVPAYVVALLCISVLFGAVGSANFFRYLFYIQNLVRQSNQVDYFSVAWSLSVEEWFYVVFPGLLLASTSVLGRNNTKSVVALSAVFIAIISLIRFWFGNFDDWGSSVRMVVIFRIDSIAYGFLLYILVHRVAPKHFGRLSSITAGAFFVATALLAFCAIVAITDHNSLLAKHLFPWLAALFGSSCILLALKMENAVAARHWLSEASFFGGRISYSVYLFHIILLGGLGSIQASQTLAIQFAAYVAGVAAVATLVYSTFEKPILLARPRLEARRPEDIVHS
jgi:peptidoglycan/LPS O-acetylase OafA/YrhL